MNIKHRCPCGATIEVTHLSTHEDRRDGQIEAASIVLAPWLEEHHQHHQDALRAHLTNLETRGHPLQPPIGPPTLPAGPLWAQPDPPAPQTVAVADNPPETPTQPGPPETP